MNTPITPVAWDNYAWPIPSQGEIPILYEDEDEDEMGEANLHVLTVQIFHLCLTAFLRKHRPKCQAFANMNLYYYRDGPPHPRTGSLPYVSPDVMVVEPFEPLAADTTSYTIGKDGPAPLLTIEVMSPGAGQHRDLIQKSILYKKLEIAEYVLLDITKKHSPGELLLRRLGKDGEYRDTLDADDGVTSDLAVRFVIEHDGLRVVNAKTGHRYARPQQAEEYAEGMHLAEERARLEQVAREKAELERRHEQAAREKAERERDALQERLRRLENEIKRRNADSDMP